MNFFMTKPMYAVASQRKSTEALPAEVVGKAVGCRCDRIIGNQRHWQRDQLRSVNTSGSFQD
jgi:hypothetical protein